MHFTQRRSKIKSVILHRQEAQQPMFFRLYTVAGTALLCSISAHGCSCDPLSAKEALAESEVVFLGKVIEIKHLNRFPRKTNEETIVTFRVDAVWKGRTGRTAKVAATAQPLMCDGYQFRADTMYVVYAIRQRTTEWDDLLQKNRSRLGLELNDQSVVYGIRNCAPRITPDVSRESSLLGPRSSTA